MFLKCSLSSVHLQKSLKKSGLALKYPPLPTHRVPFRLLLNIPFSVFNWKWDGNDKSYPLSRGKTSQNAKLWPLLIASHFPKWRQELAGWGVAFAPLSFPLSPPSQAGRCSALSISVQARIWAPWMANQGTLRDP